MVAPTAIPAMAPFERFFLGITEPEGLVTRAGVAADEDADCVLWAEAISVRVTVTGWWDVYVHVDVASTVVLALRTLFIC